MRSEWVHKELSFIRANWSRLTDEAMAERLGRTERGVVNKRRALGLQRKRGKANTTNHPRKEHPHLVRCGKRGWYMTWWEGGVKRLQSWGTWWWERNRGPIPQGSLVVNSNLMETDPANLTLTTWSELNRKHALLVKKRHRRGPTPEQREWYKGMLDPKQDWL